MSAGRKITTREIHTMLERVMCNISDVQINKMRIPARDMSLLITYMSKTKDILNNMLLVADKGRQPYSTRNDESTLIYDRNGKLVNVPAENIKQHAAEWECQFQGLLNQPSYLIPPTSVYDPIRVAQHNIPQPNRSKL